ncbi:hypothetical protein GW17_00034113 [Ensete ventricosum]|nr:hypothetical protein GW17_00034113 [Ensete ventricosum]
MIEIEMASGDESYMRWSDPPKVKGSQMHTKVPQHAYATRTLEISLIVTTTFTPVCRRRLSYSLCCSVLSVESTCTGHSPSSLSALQRERNKFFLAVKRQQIYDRNTSLATLQIYLSPQP